MVVKYEFLTRADVLPQKYSLEKTVAMEILKHSPLGEELEAATDIAKKQYQKLVNTILNLVKN